MPIVVRVSRADLVKFWDSKDGFTEGVRAKNQHVRSVDQLTDLAVRDLEPLNGEFLMALAFWVAKQLLHDPFGINGPEPSFTPADWKVTVSSEELIYERVK